MDISKLTVYSLAGYAGVSDPDSHDSPGALFLLNVRDAVIEAKNEGRFGIESFHDVLAEIADNAPNTYTHPMWLEFVDLAAYTEEIEISGENMEQNARIALYEIALRLGGELFTLFADVDTELYE